jgi:hypothetical protein
MINREAETPRSPIAVEPLESRVCLSSPIGGDFAHHVGHVAASVDGRDRNDERHAGMHRDGHARPAAMQMDGPRGGSQMKGERMSNHVDLPQVRRAVIAMPGMLLILDFAVKFNRPGLDGPGVSDDVGDVVAARGATHGGGKITANQNGKPAIVARANAAELVQAPADAMVALETAAAETNVTLVEDAVATTGPMLASATAATSVAHALASSASALVDRLTSPWHDGNVAGAVDFAADAIVTEWLPAAAAAQTFVATAVDAASNLLAPLAGGEHVASLAAAVAPAVTSVAAYEIKYMGSPFALLADSVATFVEESATVTNVVAQATSRGPWALTATVIAADVVILTYVYRRKSTRARAQRAPVGVA